MGPICVMMKKNDRQVIPLNDTLAPASDGNTTQTLLERLRAGQSITQFFEENQDSIYDFPLNECLKAYIAQKRSPHAMLIRESGMNRRYFYDILSGKRRPDQNYVLRILLALGASVADAQWLLRCASYPQLYIRNRRDAVILYALEHALCVKECNQMLGRLGLDQI